LVTNLVNRTQPLIRYELSDLVTLAEGPKPTGWPFRRIAAVEGRSDDILHLPPPITVTPVTTIEREGGQAAKFKIVKSQPPGRPG
jgi:phenylacetate-coenzyme A ligase PaaK-like adenylate-forming protein